MNITVVRGSPNAEELAAVTAVLVALSRRTLTRTRARARETVSPRPANWGRGYRAPGAWTSMRNGATPR
ncbi:acyl-CoA carboxylase subunit epsilon [Actinomadura rudentiformis]|uniref:Acyl-CoA carboxylase subunit epsilon n=1 Tax=Actinomadura rudentiformis TaxID=359158 RepID=A0A6H9YSD3_9ACTN|nr:acyl-CoA carboxylase subunit epsilon [Actinomadura rudentiformis]KAB2346152.1 acyl-CoA carboxylase subunit epsilon [Actinomadura rudentiformis]